MVRDNAPLYGFHTLLNMLKNLLEHVALFVYKCLTFDLSGDLCESHQGQCLFHLIHLKDERNLDLKVRHLYTDKATCLSLRGFSTYSGAYRSHTLGHSVGPLVH